MPVALIKSKWESGDLVFTDDAGTEIARFDESAVTLDIKASKLAIGGTAVTATAAEINAIAGTGLSAAELGVLDGVTAGTVTAGKAVVTTTDKHIDALVITDGGLALGAGAGTAITSTAAELNILDGVTATAAELNLIDGSVAGTAVASKALALGANKNVDVLAVADGGLSLGAGAGTAIAATAAEINRAADVSARIVSLAATSLAVTEAAHSDKIIVLNHTRAASTATLPDATGSGAVFRFIVGAVNTSNHVVTVPDANNTLKGSVNILDNDANAQTAYAASGTDDTLTLNGTTTGGQIGDWVELVDIAADTWAIRGQLLVPAGSNVADPFSAAV